MINTYKDIPTRPEQVGYAVGDEVYVTKGEKKGITSKIVSIDYKTKSFILAEGPTQKVLVPPSMVPPGHNSRLIEYPLRMTEKEIQLVGTFYKDGKVANKFIAAQVEYQGAEWSDEYNRMMPHRVVKGHRKTIRIPWPAPEPFKDSVMCTPAETVLKTTYQLDSLVESPIPADALPTIRNPHSKFRKNNLTEKDIWKLTPPKMPLSETKKAALAERAAFKAKGWTALTPEMKDFIGERVAKHVNEVSDVQVKEHLNSLMRDVKNVD
ncbi:hypothetical protein BABINDRAFT_30584 [Babjeviella inositovora NRRL Y-12698]|uniref:KOW domain-containing protein n=1 Tax=Babjeviella inositovora NRRL Y-12698 TaxID=984486 RepID=A0A1E3QY01_9ASCO|nr:uncharacterized protein BABINDRAFT_30584 [Babjeviella inositovora NRRL Y-12698]ODQ82530.1 hypothetical protein BABINDRAFT_30584 [Babjeviella inositovora NRRL Y-12698]